MEEARVTTVGERIAQVRKEAGLSQVDLAELAGVSNKSISLWETGAKSPRAEMIEKIAHALDIKFKWLMYGTGDKTEAETRERKEAAIKKQQYSYRSSDESRLRSINLCIKVIHAMPLSDNEKKSVYNSLSEIRSELEEKIYFKN